MRLTLAADKTPAAVYGNAFRMQRMRDFVALADQILLTKSVCRIIDIGGETDYWMGLEEVWKGRSLDITLVNLRHESPPDPRFTYVEGDARSLDQFADDSFHIAHSNSVIEHVGGWADKKAMAAEIRRLAPLHFVQTPNYWFPYEPHMRLPFIHWLPVPWQRRIVMLRACGFYPRARSVAQADATLSDAALLNMSEMRNLFPDSEIRRERFALFTKSLIAIRNTNLPDSSHGTGIRTNQAQALQPCA
jgi:hypothetical protein